MSKTLVPSSWASQKTARTLELREAMKALVKLLTEHCKLRHDMNRIGLVSEVENQLLGVRNIDTRTQAPGGNLHQKANRLYEKGKI